MTVSAGTGPETMVSHVRSELRSAETAGLAFAGLTAVWSAAIWTFGLEHERGLSRAGAAGLAGGVAVLYFLGALV